MGESNGSGKSRLDRIEEILERHSTMMISIDASIERQVLANDAAHEFFQAEDQRLLTAQILMNGAMQKVVETTDKLAETTHKLAETMHKLVETTQRVVETTQRVVEAMSTLELKMEETTAKLNALIDTVDGMIRKKPE
jgi:methyl-accepting chemotaxis protein